MRVSGTKLVDANVWLALVYGRHTKHASIVKWFEENSTHRLAFCRVTQMALLRHLTNKSILGADVVAQNAAWKIYDQLLQDERVIFLPEPREIEEFWRGLASSSRTGHLVWTDAYLAAFAMSYEISMATCDRDFQNFPGLELTIL